MLEMVQFNPPLVMTRAFWLSALKTDGPITGNITGSCHFRQ